MFQWPSELGGADTRLKDLIRLFGSDKRFKVKVIPNDDFRLTEKENTDFINKNNAECLKWSDLGEKLDGIAISCCNFRIFEEDFRIKKIKNSGLKFIWMNDMFFRTKKEEFYIENGFVDLLLYTTIFHKNKMDEIDENSGFKNSTKFYIVPNYFHLDNFKYFERKEKESFFIGKHSRPDWIKFSNDFPAFYENLNLKNPKFRVMGIDNNFHQRFNWYKFNERWTLLKPNEENTQEFLNSLDTYIYNSHHSFIENESRAIVEAGLTGLPIIAPKKYYFTKQIIHGETGFLYENYQECVRYAKQLESDFKLRLEFGRNSSLYLKRMYCNKNYHLDLWKKVFNQLDY